MSCGGVVIGELNGGWTRDGPERGPERITVGPGQMGGVPGVRGLRIPVGKQRILEEYADLEAEDVRKCLRYAAARAMEREPPLPRPA